MTERVRNWKSSSAGLLAILLSSPLNCAMKKASLAAGSAGMPLRLSGFGSTVALLMGATPWVFDLLSSGVQPLGSFVFVLVEDGEGVGLGFPGGEAAGLEGDAVSAVAAVDLPSVGVDVVWHWVLRVWFGGFPLGVYLDLGRLFPRS